MNITDIRIRRTYTEGRLRALVSITLDGDFAVHDVKVIEGPQRLFVAMPSRKDENGVFRDIVHPITSEARTELEESILEAYHKYLEQPPAPYLKTNTDVESEQSSDEVADSQSSYS